MGDDSPPTREPGARLLTWPALQPGYQFRVYGALGTSKVPAHKPSDVPRSGHGRAGSLQKLRAGSHLSLHLWLVAPRVLFFPMSSLAKMKRLDSFSWAPK